MRAGERKRRDKNRKGLAATQSGSAHAGTQVQRYRRLGFCNTRETKGGRENSKRVGENAERGATGRIAKVVGREEEVGTGVGEAEGSGTAQDGTAAGHGHRREANSHPGEGKVRKGEADLAQGAQEGTREGTYAGDRRELRAPARTRSTQGADAETAADRESL